MKFPKCRLILFIILGGILLPRLAFAGTEKPSINWQKLNLNPYQSAVIKNLEVEWNRVYLKLQPEIIDDQHKLTQLLTESQSDPLEIMSLQHALARKQEQLREVATANYLHKRQVLNAGQRLALEGMVQQVVAEKQHVATLGVQHEALPDNIQILMRRMQHIWPVNAPE